MPSTFNVYFAAWGEWPDASDLTSLIGREPDEFTAKGTLRGRSGLLTKRSVWRILSGRDETETIESHLQALLTLLESHAEGIRRVAGDHDAGINCAAYWETSQPGFHVSATLIARIAALGLSLDFDMYCMDDEEESGG